MSIGAPIRRSLGSGLRPRSPKQKLSLRRGYLFSIRERLNRFAILIDPFWADEARLPKGFIDAIRDPNRTVNPTLARAPLLPGLRRYRKHLSL
jgi:hypothetical protein